VQALERMDRYGLGTAILSMSNWVSGAKEPSPSQLIGLCRECNDYGAKLVADHPTRFGQFGSVMMLPDVDAALKEIEYAFDTLKVDGIGLLTHYGPGVYLGEPALDPVLEELNRRQAVVFVHPASPWYEFRSDPSKNPVKMPNAFALELTFDTTRAMMNVLDRETVSRFPNIKFIWPHAGGPTIFILSRAAVLWRRQVGSQEAGERSFKETFDGLAKTMATFYYDLTQMTTPATIPAIQAIAPASHIVFGSDIPRAGHYTRDFLDLLPTVGVAAADVAAIVRTNAEALFPRIRARSA
jgi:predicted TIM-barrel fold metal-dependent hydrolase